MRHGAFLTSRQGSQARVARASGTASGIFVIASLTCLSPLRAKKKSHCRGSEHFQIVCLEVRDVLQKTGKEGERAAHTLN